MSSWPMTTMGQLHQKNPPASELPTTNRPQLPVDGERYEAGEQADRARCGDGGAGPGQYRADREADQERHPPEAEQHAGQRQQAGEQDGDVNPHGFKLQVLMPGADCASLPLSIGLSSPSHQGSTRFVYQLEAGFSLCPPGYTPWDVCVPQSTTILQLGPWGGGKAPAAGRVLA